MTGIKVLKRNVTHVKLANLVKESGNIGLNEILKKYYINTFEHGARSIVAGPRFIQFLSRLFRIQIVAGEILQFESGNDDKSFKFALSGTDDKFKLQ